MGALLCFPEDLLKSYVKAHTRRLKDGRKVEIAAHYDKRVLKGTEHAPEHGHNLNHLDTARRDLFSRVHAEQHLLHHYKGHALRQRLAALEREHQEHVTEAEGHAADGKNVDAAKAMTRAHQVRSRILRHQKDLADIEHKVAALGTLKESMVQGSGAVGESTDATHAPYAAKLGTPWKPRPSRAQRLLLMAVKHLEQDQRQNNLPEKERKEDAELVAKLKTGLESEPQEGDTKTENGLTYVLRGGRWHRETTDDEQQATDESEPSPEGADHAPPGAVPVGQDHGRADTAEQPYASDGIKLSRGNLTQLPAANQLPEDIAGSLRPHGRDAVNLALEQFQNGYKAFLIADGTGAGKTRQALAVAEMLRRAGPDRPILIVTQNARVVTDAFGKDAVAMGIAMTAAETLSDVKGGGIYVTTYSRLGRGDFEGGQFDTVMFDEAHNLKNFDSKKSKRAKDLLQAAKRSLLLTATPGDKPEHVGYLATAFGFSFQKAMGALGYSKGTYGYELTRGVTKDQSLQRLGTLFDDFTRRGLMVKREVSMDNLDVETADIRLTDEQTRRVEQAHDNMLGMVEKAEPRHRGLVKMLGLNKLRTVLEPYKIDATISAVERDLAAGKKVVVFANRINASDLPAWWPEGDELTSVGTLDTLAERLESRGIKVGRLYGKHLGKAQATIQGFQGGPSQVVIATPQAGGTGINLDDAVGDKPRSMVVMTAPFSSLEAVQQIGRINRLTTKSRAAVTFVKAQSVAVDSWNFGIIGAKLSALGATVKGDVARLNLRGLSHLSDEDLERIGANNVPVEEGQEVRLSRIGLKTPEELAAQAEQDRQSKVKTYLRVPFSEKDRLKAKYPRNVFNFDPARKQWYCMGPVPDDLQKYLEAHAPTGPGADAKPGVMAVASSVKTQPLTLDQIAAVEAAVLCVAGMCDGGKERDDHGFNKQDAMAGRMYAMKGSLTPEEAANARAMVYKYKGQFGDDLAKRMGNPNETPEVAPSANTALYKGRRYHVAWQGKTKFGERAKLVGADGREFWVDRSALEKSLGDAVFLLRPGVVDLLKASMPRRDARVLMLLSNDPLWKSYIHGHYRTNQKTGAKVWVESYQDKRRAKTERELFAHDNHRREHFIQNLAQGRIREALHAFHDLDHAAAHKLAAELKLHDGKTLHANKKELMQALHQRVMSLHGTLSRKLAEQEAKGKATTAAPAPKPSGNLDFAEVQEMAERKGAGLTNPDDLFKLFDHLDPQADHWPAKEVRKAIVKVNQVARSESKDKARQALLNANGGSPLGLEVKKPDSHQHGVVIPDASHPGKYRNSRWDQHGFYTHSTHDTPEQALDDLIHDGFTEHAPGSLDRMAGADEWARGMDAAWEVQKHNAESLKRRQASPEGAQLPSVQYHGPDPEDLKLDIAGEEVPFEYQLVDAAKLAPTTDKADNQFRDRNRAASEEQVAAMAGNLKFRLLSDSPLMDYGSPVLAKDGKTIIGGNGRSLAIRRAYSQGKADDYRAALVRQAQKFGLDPAKVQGMQQPVLVRVLQQDVDVRQAAIASNEGGGARMSALEQARVDGERLGDLSDFYADEDGNLNTAVNRPFIRRFLASVPVAQRPAFQAGDGGLSQEGITRLRNAVLFRAYGDTDTLSRMVESADPGQRNVLAALTRVAPVVAQAKDDAKAGRLHDLDVSADIVAATATLAKIRDDKKFGSVDDYLNQQTLFGDGLSPEAATILKHFDQHLRSAKAMGEFLRDYYEAVRQIGDPNQGSLFGDPIPTKSEVMGGVHARNQASQAPASQASLL